MTFSFTTVVSLLQVAMSLVPDIEALLKDIQAVIAAHTAAGASTPTTPAA